MNARTKDFFDNVLATTRAIFDAWVATNGAQIAAKDARIAKLEEKIEYLEARLRMTEKRENQQKTCKTE